MGDEIPQLRLANPSDTEAIDALMKESIREIFPRFYYAKQTASSEIHVGYVDRMLVEDGTYFVAEVDRELVASGGWSRRNKLFSGEGVGADDVRLLDPGTEPARVRAMFVRSDWTRRGLGRAILEACEAAAKSEGFQMLALMATLPGVPLYARYGFKEIEPSKIVMPDGVTIGSVAMEKPID